MDGKYILKAGLTGATPPGILAAEYFCNSN
jgi:hypothetical protein